MIWDFDPVAFSIFGLSVRWYGLVYIAGFFGALYGGFALQKKILEKPFPKDVFENLVFGAFLWGVIGGRLGHFLFYDIAYFWTAPLDILKVWQGGMSIHGGILGTTLFLFFWTRHHQRSFLEVSDVLVLPLAITLIFGRLANFINGELVGAPTHTDWGVVFPHVDELLRHPTQLYESAKNVLLSGGLAALYMQGYGRYRGILTSVFLMGYGILRAIIEFYKKEGWIFLGLNTGQWLCIAMIIIGGHLMVSQVFKLQTHDDSPSA